MSVWAEADLRIFAAGLAVGGKFNDTGSAGGAAIVADTSTIAITAALGAASTIALGADKES